MIGDHRETFTALQGFLEKTEGVTTLSPAETCHRSKEVRYETRRPRACSRRWHRRRGLFAVCAFFVAIAPGETSALFSYVMHVDLTGLARHITWASFFGGLLIFSLVMALHVGVAGWLYNVLSACGQGRA
jgi:hypothetical protein